MQRLYATDDLRALMEEPAGGDNYGRTATNDPERWGHRVELDARSAQARTLFATGGFAVAFPSTGGAGSLGDAGMTSHRGVLQPDEYVDTDALRARVEDAFGFTLDELRAVYRRGRPSAGQGELRARVDARLLALSRAGANMELLARLLGLGKSEGTWPRALKNALTRARAAEVAA